MLMLILTKVLVAFVAIEHLGFMVLEMVLWTQPTGRRIFGMSAEQAKATAQLAANQGLYNGFLAAGLIVGLVSRDTVISESFTGFFLCCVIVAGVYGGWSVKRRIMWVQAAPAFVALVVFFAGIN